jgi:hypothetical protein
MGRAAPEWSNRKRDLTVCTGGITQKLEWRRLFPIVIEDLDKLHGFSWVDVKVTRDGVGDPRPESRKVVRGYGQAVTEVGKVSDHSIRKWYVEKLVRDCSESMKEAHETVGIVKPQIISYDVVEFEPKKNPLNDEAQTTLSTWVTFFDPRKAQDDYKKEYATKDFEVRFKFKCGPKCRLENGHDMKVLDLQAFMLYRNVSRRYSDMPTIFQKMKDKLNDTIMRNDVYFVLGTHRLYPFQSYMIGALVSIKKGTVATQPLEVAA